MNRLLIIINPYSGKKQGEQILNNILNIFKNQSYDIIKTTHPNHPYEIANSIDINKFIGICAVGGDGTMHEIINGMLSREDRKQIPIGLIPSGTGNSFMHDLDSLNPIIAAKKITQLQTRKIDLMKIMNN